MLPKMTIHFLYSKSTTVTKTCQAPQLNLVLKSLKVCVLFEQGTNSTFCWPAPSVPGHQLQGERCVQADSGDATMHVPLAVGAGLGLNSE